jgi:hypothetical protein
LLSIGLYCVDVRAKVKYKEQRYDIDQLGAFEYARSIDFSYLPLAFFTYQVINLLDQRQLLLQQIRDSLNRPKVFAARPDALV